MTYETEVENIDTTVVTDCHWFMVLCPCEGNEVEEHGHHSWIFLIVAEHVTVKVNKWCNTNACIGDIKKKTFIFAAVTFSTESCVKK